MTRVLVVDDSQDVRLITRIALETAGYEVDEAADGAEACATLEAAAPDAVLLDLRMPGVDGWEVLERLRSRPHLTGVPVVIFTAHATVGDDPRLRPREWVLTKPFRQAELLRTIESALTGEPTRPSS